MALSDQLQIPDAAGNDSKSFELLRVWVANKRQHVSLRAGVWEDPAAWGVMLSDLMHHVANAYYHEMGFDSAKTLQRIKEGLDAEFANSTDSHTGH